MPPFDTNPAEMSNNSSTDDADGCVIIIHPGEHDVLLGRGGGTNSHIGNIKFRKLVNQHKMRYFACSKVDKPKVAREVVVLWRQMSPPGRFLTRKDDSRRGPGSIKGDETEWVEVGDKKAREKASQCLRERTSDVIPYIQQLREQQDAETEHGVSIVSQKLQRMDTESMEESPLAGRVPQQGVGVSVPADAFSPRSQPPCTPNTMALAPQDPSMMYPQPMSYCANDLSYPTPDDPVPIQEMTEAEYQQRMFYMQQQLQMQQMQLLRMQQQRLMLQQGGCVPGMATSRGYPGGSQTTNCDNYTTPTLSGSSDLRAPKRTLSKNIKYVTPDRQLSNAEFNSMEEGELSLEEYRQQLENFLANCNVEKDTESDLEDDEWQKERQMAYRQHVRSPRRGVGRNLSGISMMSYKSTGSSMSIISGMSGLSDLLDLSNGSRRNVDRNISGDLSLMSQLTDLSHNIDALSLCDEL